VHSDSWSDNQIPHRKNALFYKALNGARAGDL
jgi:hypothetical protein